MEDEKKVVRWEIYFSGAVQAVGFRFTAKMYAKDLKLTGYVMNLDDGRVLMEVQGPEEKIQQLLVDLHSSPPIRIEEYKIRELPLREHEYDFRITGW